LLDQAPEGEALGPLDNSEEADQSEIL
jgi:hypothetical protein